MRIVAAISIAMCTAFGTSFAQDMPQILFHVERTNFRYPCLENRTSLVIETAADLLPEAYNVFLLAVDNSQASPMTGIQFGIDYDAEIGSGIDVYAWHSCAPIEVPTTGWPAPGTGNVIVWANGALPQSVQIHNSSNSAQVIGYFYCGAYGEDAFSISGDPRGGIVATSRSDGSTTKFFGAEHKDLSSVLFGYVSFSKSRVKPGYNPLEGVVSGVEETMNGQFRVKASQSGPIVIFDIQLDQSGRYSIEVVDVQGRLVYKLWEGQHAAGKHTVNWDAETPDGRLASGLYYVKLRGTSSFATTKVVFAR